MCTERGSEVNQILNCVFNATKKNILYISWISMEEINCMKNFVKVGKQKDIHSCGMYVICSIRKFFNDKSIVQDSILNGTYR